MSKAFVSSDYLESQSFFILIPAKGRTLAGPPKTFARFGIAEAVFYVRGQGESPSKKEHDSNLIMPLYLRYHTPWRCFISLLYLNNSILRPSGGGPAAIPMSGGRDRPWPFPYFSLTAHRSTFDKSFTVSRMISLLSRYTRRLSTTPSSSLRRRIRVPSMAIFPMFRSMVVSFMLA